MYDSVPEPTRLIFYNQHSTCTAVVLEIASLFIGNIKPSCHDDNTTVYFYLEVDTFTDEQPMQRFQHLLSKGYNQHK